MAYDVKTNTSTMESGKSKKILLFDDVCKKWDLIVSVNGVFKTINNVILGDTYTWIIGKVEEDSNNASTEPVLVTLYDDTMRVSVAVENTTTWEVVEWEVQGAILETIVEETIEDIEIDKSCAYRFLNYDGEVLQAGRIMKGNTPTYIWWTPTRETSEGITYTFAWWSPEIGAISEDTDFIAQFEWVWYTSFEAFELRMALQEEAPDIDAMSINWVKKTLYSASWSISSEEYLACWEAMNMWDETDGMVFIQTNANTELVAYEYKTREELWDDYNTYRRAFQSSSRMTDEIWSAVSGFFSSEVHVVTTWDLVAIDYNNGDTIIVDKVSHNMRYNADYYVELLANECATEYNTLVTNWWLTDGTYELEDASTIQSVISSIKTKGKTWNIMYSNIYVTSSWDFVEAHVDVKIDWNYIYRYKDNQKITLTDDKAIELSNFIAENKVNRGKTINSDNTVSIFIPDWVVNWTIEWAIIESIVENAIFVSPLGASIVHDIVNWEIILTNNDWTNSITIMDKNLWASIVYNRWDELSESNCWKYYQWWNNYGFSFTGNVPTSNTRIEWSLDTDNSTFITVTQAPFDWCINGNLSNRWWCEADVEIARQWPAPSWYHIPTTDELSSLIQLFEDITGYYGNWDKLSELLKLPFAGNRNSSDANINSQGSYGYYWSSSPYSATSDCARDLSLNSSYAYAGGYSRRACGFSVRCFKNSYIRWEKILFSWERGEIIHNIDNWEIIINYIWNDSSLPTQLVIADKNLGCTFPSFFGDYYCWWGNSPFVTPPTNEGTEDWANVQSIVPNWFHIPTLVEMKTLYQLVNAIVNPEEEYLSTMEYAKYILAVPYPKRDSSGNITYNQWDGWFRTADTWKSFNWWYNTRGELDLSNNNGLQVRPFKNTTNQQTIYVEE